MTEESVRLKTVQCSLSESEYSNFEKKAAALGLSTSSYLRLLCLRVETSIDLKPLKDGSIDTDGSILKIVQCRLSNDEYDNFRQKANSVGLKTSPYLKLLCLRAEIYISLTPLEDEKK